MTRTREVDVDLPPRVSWQSFGSHRLHRIHANALNMRRPDVNGIETFYFSNPRAGRLASYLQQQIMDVSSERPTAESRQGRFFVIRRTAMPAALIEMGFVTGDIDAPRLARPDHRRRLALAHRHRNSRLPETGDAMTPLLGFDSGVGGLTVLKQSAGTPRLRWTASTWVIRPAFPTAIAHRLRFDDCR